MEELYQKILKNEIDIKYLSPSDLVNLMDYLHEKNVELEELLKEIKKEELIEQNNNQQE